MKPKKRDDLIAGINEYWQTVTVQRCNTYIDHLYKVMPDVVRCGGEGMGIQQDYQLMSRARSPCASAQYVQKLCFAA